MKLSAHGDKKVRHFIKINALVRSPEIAIEEEVYERIKLSRAILREALAIEEMYAALIENYLALEREAINFSISNMVYTPAGYEAFFEQRLSLEIRISSVLTASKLYMDSLGSRIAGCLSGLPDIDERVADLFKQEYDNSFEYRFMAALRNHIQHSGNALSSVGSGGSWIGDDESKLLEWSISMSSTKKELAKNSKFKKSVLQEMPDSVDLLYATRRFVQSINNIHLQSRAMIDTSATDARNFLKSLIEGYQQQYNDSTIGLCAFHFDAEKKIEEAPILLKWDDERIRLIDKNGRLGSLSRMYVTNRIKR